MSVVPLDQPPERLTLNQAAILRAADLGELEMSRRTVWLGAKNVTRSVTRLAQVGYLDIPERTGSIELTLNGRKALGIAPREGWPWQFRDGEGSTLTIEQPAGCTTLDFVVESDECVVAVFIPRARAVELARKILGQEQPAS